jgi:hypothetical protein
MTHVAMTHVVVVLQPELKVKDGGVAKDTEILSTRMALHILVYSPIF